MSRRPQTAVDIPIIVSTPGLHCHAETGPSEYPFASTTGTHAENCTPLDPARPTMISHATQTDPEEETSSRFSPKKQSPVHSRSPSNSRKPHGSWAEQLLSRLSSPHSHHGPVAVDAAGRPLLTAPGVETPKRPTTPRADLYKGQSDANFGMTFENSGDVHFRKANKPTASPYSYEDQKHRMMMDWLERRA
ncbi:uncharacterized protein Z518_08534 [Rhinocladiella mackenziei CBS 650.93]|uniref:Rhinocladiella mackenziei CBS 650.93 unplaced genomic scaffold supercont1.6, whole genome shotgun sequence n=1 Tax=Rhinocladiella mackenziei CBS 650.93 TaxID=1442369 RepID=A0A0D2GWJ6_9EURO|nr:uncharacterized protein Z518_08534 [Rhinocladiella mackenziei CBS 650.93]KIX02593.1 hypothetical protein Z518_08534 [Rhinocladiella mackenziei CBS 650.93]